MLRFDPHILQRYTKVAWYIISHGPMDHGYRGCGSHGMDRSLTWAPAKWKHSAFGRPDWRWMMDGCDADFLCYLMYKPTWKQGEVEILHIGRIVSRKFQWQYPSFLRPERHRFRCFPLLQLCKDFSLAQTLTVACTGGVLFKGQIAHLLLEETLSGPSTTLWQTRMNVVWACVLLEIA